MAVYRKDCELVRVVEIGRLRAADFPTTVVKYDGGDEIYLLLQPSIRDPFIVVHLDPYLKIINYNSYWIKDYSRISANDLMVYRDRVYVVGDVWQAGPEGAFLLDIDRETLIVANHTILGDRPFLWILSSFGAVDSDGYIYIASTASKTTPPLATGSILFKLDNSLNLVYTQHNVIGFTSTHMDDDRPYSGLLLVRGLDVSDTQVFIVGGIFIDERDTDGFVVVANKTDGLPFYFLKIVSREGNAYTGGPRVNSVAEGVRVYRDCAYITGQSENYYLEYEPLNPTGTSTTILSTISGINEESPSLIEDKNFNREEMLNPVFDRDAAPLKWNGFYGVLCMSPITARSISTTTSTSTVTTTSTTTETTTPTTTVTRFTTSTRTAVATRVETEYVFSTVFTTRVVEGTVTRFETHTSVTTIPYHVTLTDTTTVRLTATTTPTVFATVQTTVLHNQTIVKTEAVRESGRVPWELLLISFIPLLLLTPLVLMSGRSLTITILEGAGERPPILKECFRPSVGRLKKNGKVTFHNKDKLVHRVELYGPDGDGRVRKFTIKSGQRVRIKMEEAGKYFFSLEVNPERAGILEVG